MSWLQGPARGPLLYLVMALLLVLVGVLQSWNVALAILCMCLVSAVMALGANIAWGYAGLMNVGLMGFAALGGLAVVLAAQPPPRVIMVRATSEMITGRTPTHLLT